MGAHEISNKGVSVVGWELQLGGIKRGGALRTKKIQLERRNELIFCISSYFIFVHCIQSKVA